MNNPPRVPLNHPANILNRVSVRPVYVVTSDRRVLHREKGTTEVFQTLMKDEKGNSLWSTRIARHEYV